MYVAFIIIHDNEQYIDVLQTCLNRCIVCIRNCQSVDIIYSTFKLQLSSRIRFVFGIVDSFVCVFHHYYDLQLAKMDLDLVSHVDPGTLTDPETNPIVDPGLNMDIVHHLHTDMIHTEDLEEANTLSSEETVQTVHCLNCGTDITQRRSHCLDLIEVRSVITQWVAPQVVRI